MAIFSKSRSSIFAMVCAAIALSTTEVHGQVIAIPFAPQLNQSVGHSGRIENKLDAPSQNRIALKLQNDLDIPKDKIVDCLSRFEQNKRCGVGEIMKSYSIIWEALRNCNDENSQILSLLCWHLLQDISDPTQINQGNHNTCALASLQSFLSIKHPSIVCRVVIDAWNNKFSLPGGRQIILEKSNLLPDRESRFYRPGEYCRSYASQIFQIAAANAFWQSQTKDPRDLNVPLGSIRYIQDYMSAPGNRKETGERLFIHWADNILEQVVGDSSLYPESSPCFTMEAINQTYKILTKLDDAPVLLAHKSKKCRKPVMSFSNEASLKEMLVSAKLNNQLPVILSLNMSSSVLTPARRLLLLKDNKLVYASVQNSGSLWHVINVTDFDESTDSIAVDNFWGPSSDHLENRLSLHELWSGTFAAAPEKGQIGAHHSSARLKAE